MAKTDNDSNQVVHVESSVTRRDFLNGVAVAAGGTIANGLLPAFMTAAEGAPAQDADGYYPPALTGLRGNHPGSFETAHALRDADFWSHAGAIAATGEDYVSSSSAAASAGWRPRISTAPGTKARASSSSTTTTMSAVTPSAMNSQPTAG
jgi:hypothetical protein